MSWLRLDASAFHDRAIRRAGSHGRRAFIAALMLTRERDWRKNDKPGWLPASEFDATEVALHWGERTSPSTLAAYTEAIDVLASEGGPFAWDGDGWLIRNWGRAQPDPTALARKRKQRAEQWKQLKQARDGDCHSDKNEPVKAEDADVTVGHCESRPTIRVRTRSRVRDGTERTRTRDVSSQEGEDSGSASASAGEPASASPELRGSELHEALLSAYRAGVPEPCRNGLEAALKARKDGDPTFDKLGQGVLRHIAATWAQLAQARSA